MEINSMKLKLLKMTLLNFQDFMKKHELKNDTMEKSELQRVCKLPIYPRDTKIYSVEGFVNIDNESQRGIHWTCFIAKDNKSYYFDSFGGKPDKFLLNELPKPLIYHKYRIQDMCDSKLCGSYCLYFFLSN